MSKLNNVNFSLYSKGYKVYYTTNPNQPEASWNSQMVDNSELTTISELTPLAIYTIRVQAFTSMGAGPMSNPVQVKTQQGNLNFQFALKVNLMEIHCFVFQECLHNLVILEQLILAKRL